MAPFSYLIRTFQKSWSREVLFPVRFLVCDVWEHAYYLKVQNRRAEYVDNFMKIINWEKVAKRYSKVKG